MNASCRDTIIVAAIKMIERINWNDTRIFLREMPELLFVNKPFNTATGLKAESTKAGYMPTSNAPAENNRNNVIQNKGTVPIPDVKNPLLRLLPINWLYKGFNEKTIMAASMSAKKLITTDSNKNCPTSCERWAPTTFLSPTSFPRSSDFAVERFT